MDYDGDDDVPFSKANKGSGSYNSLLNQEEGYTIAAVSNKAGERMRKHHVMLRLVVIFLPLIILL